MTKGHKHDDPAYGGKISTAYPKSDVKGSYFSVYIKYAPLT